MGLLPGNSTLSPLLRSTVVTCVTVALVGATLAAIPAPAAAVDPPVAAFDYSMPKRFGEDQNGDGKIDYFTGTSDAPVIIGGQEKQVNPTSWRVNLDACASTAGSTFVWAVIDHPDPANPLAVQGGPGCGDYYLTVPEEGTYRVVLVATKDGVPSAPVLLEVVVQDWLVVSVGDSYGSGEGVPDIPISNAALVNAEQKWTDAAAAWQEVTTVRASYAGIQAAIDSWNAHTAEAAYRCDPTDSRADALRCAELGLLIAGDAAWIVGEGITFGLIVVGETVLDVINAIGATLQALEATAVAAVQVARSITGQLQGQWQSRRCHRSANAGSARAAKQLEDVDPHTSVTFLHLSCSGASVVYGLLGMYEGAENAGVHNADCPSDPAKCIRPQIDVAKELIGNREVDAVYVSIGGNDAHFADLIIACILQNNCQDRNNWVADPRSNLKATFCGSFGALAFAQVVKSKCEEFFDLIPDFFASADELWQEGKNGDTTPPIDPMFAGHATLYANLNSAVLQQPGDSDGWLLPTGRSDRLFLSQYVDAVKYDDGRYCDWATDGFATLPFFSTNEARWVTETVSPELTANIMAATAAHAWTFVGGIFDGFTNHGYCANDHYIVRAEEAFLRQGNYQGMVHPNMSGHGVYAANIFNAWRAKLYTGGSYAQPRRPDQRPFADAGGPYTVVEGSTVAMPNTSWDGDGDPMTFAWTATPAGRVAFEDADDPQPTLRGVDDGTGTITVNVSDADGSRGDTASVTVTNAPPVITAMGLPVDPVQHGTAVAPTATFTDPGVSDTHTATWTWGDGSSSAGVVTESGGSGSVGGTHTYAGPGIYTVSLTVDDGDTNGSTTQVFEYVVVYDPTGGFTTGGGWIDSPAGAYTPGDSTDPDVTGHAVFGFVSKYAKGATVPSGTTSFKFKAAGLDFGSTAYQYLVIAGSRAQYKGTGTVNGAPGYGFILAAVDGDREASPTSDRFRVKIWNTATGVTVYDNQAGSADDGIASTAIGGGQIQVHAGSKR